MLVHGVDKTELISANHRDGDIYQIRLEHLGQATMMVEFTRFEIATIIQRLEHMLSKEKEATQNEQS